MKHGVGDVRQGKIGDRPGKIDSSDGLHDGGEDRKLRGQLDPETRRSKRARHRVLPPHRHPWAYKARGLDQEIGLFPAEDCLYVALVCAVQLNKFYGALT